MRRRLIGSAASAMVLVLALTSLAYGAAQHQRVTALDACDGPSFNAVIGPGTCERGGGVKFDDFIGQLIAMGQAPAWRFAPESMTLANGGTIDAYNRGGEFHTFTEVAAFGGGCVPELNAILGLLPVPECGVPGIFGTTGIAPGGELEGAPLSTGTHLFECLIHPWMRTTVTVE
jgi:plastocyanin